MAYYIKDKLSILSAKTDIGLDTIVKWLEYNHKDKPTIDINADRIIILTKCLVYDIDTGKHLVKAGTTTNPVTIYDHEIVINPTVNDIGENITSELCEFIKSLCYIIRDEKINEILK